MKVLAVIAIIFYTVAYGFLVVYMYRKAKKILSGEDDESAE